jgi:hypothetical protein
MAILQINGGNLTINALLLTINGSEADPAPAPVVVTQHRGKGKKQQIHTQGPWAYR